MLLSKPQAIRPQNGHSALMEALDRMNRAEETTAAGLHERYLDDVFRYVLRRVLRVEEAEDITAEVFAAALAALPRFRGDSGHYAWLLGIANPALRRLILHATVIVLSRYTSWIRFSSLIPSAIGR